MKNAAIYARVSTPDQHLDARSLLSLARKSASCHIAIGTLTDSPPLAQFIRALRNKRQAS